MTYAEIEAYSLTKPEAELCFPFDWETPVIKVCGYDKSAFISSCQSLLIITILHVLIKRYSTGVQYDNY